jgi:hypothetical protein
MADGKRDVEFRIRATDQTGAGSRSVEQNADKVTAALARQAAQATRTAEATMNLYTKSSEKLTEAQKNAVQARKAYDEFATSLSGVAEPSKKQTREFEKLGSAAERADADVAKLNDTLERQAARFNQQVNRATAIDAEITAIRQRAVEEDAAYKKAEQAALRHAAALEEAQRVQREMQSLQAFRKVGEDAEAAVGDLDRFTTASKMAGVGSADLSSRLRSLLDPASDARASLAGLEGEVNRLVASVGDGTRPLRELQDEIYDLGRTQQAILKQASSLDAYRNQSEAVDRSAQSYERARAEVLRLSQAIQAADAPTDELTRSLRQAEAAAEAAAMQLDRDRTTLGRLKQTLDTAGVSTANLTKEEKRLQTAAEATAGALKKVDAAQKGTNTKAGQFLGLRPYELTNLSYQINDIFTQLASGTPIFQILGQQGGQVLQLFPKIMSAALSMAPALLAAGAAFGTLALGVARYLENEQMLRSFNAQLSLNVDGLRYNADALAKNARELQQYGIKLDDARKGLTRFVNEGIDPSKLVEYSKASKNLADVLGIEVVDAQEKVSKAFTGGYKQIAELDDAINFLSVSEREHIKTLFDQGDAIGATDEAFKALYDRAEDAAQKQRGPWKQATEEFGKAWQGFLDDLAGSDSIKIVTFELQGLINMASAAMRFLKGNKPEVTSKPGAPDPNKTSEVPKALQKRGFFSKLFTGDWFDVQRNFERDQFQQNVAKGVSALGQPSDASKESARQAKLANDLVSKYEDQTKALDKLNKAQRVKLAGDKAVNEATDKGIKNEAELLRIRQAAEKYEGIKADKDISAKAKSDASKQNAADARIRAEQNARESIERAIMQAESTMNARIGRQQKTDLTARLKAIDDTYTKVYADLGRLQEKGGKSVDGVPIAEVRARLDATKQILKNQEQLAYYEDALAAKTDERKSALKEITDQYAAGQITATEAFQKTEQIQKDLGPGVAQMADDAIRFADALNAANPTPELRAFIRSMRATSGAEKQRGTPNDPAKDTAKSLLSGEETKLNILIQQRAALVGVLKEQYDAGLIGLTEYRDKTMQAFEGTQPAVLKAAENFRAILEATKSVISPELYDTWIAKLQLVEQASGGVDENLKAIQDQLEQTFTGGIVDMVGTLGDSIGGLIEGTMSWGDAIHNVWDGFRSFAADFLRQIAQMIVQQAVLNALKGAAASSGGGIFKSIATAIVGATTGATVKHKGGLGGSGPKTQMPTALFMSAPRFHEGYTPPDLGLSAGEQAAIIKTDEEVLTSDNPRHIKNWGKGSGGSGSGRPQVTLKNVNVFDSADVVTKGLSSKQGEEAVLNIIRENPTVIANVVGTRS